MKLSVLSLYQTNITQDHSEQEDRSKILNNRTEQLIQLISKVHSIYLDPKIFGVNKALFSEFSMETIGKKFEACSFLSIWLIKLDGRMYPGVPSARSLQEMHPVLRCDHLPSCS